VPLDQLRFGDVLVFRAEAGATVHAAVYLAEDLLFSKDGWTMHRAWELVRIARERAVYHTAPRIVAYRAP
jgi:cell wall-associated NlpC family hydrolase